VVVGDGGEVAKNSSKVEPLAHANSKLRIQNSKGKFQRKTILKTKRLILFALIVSAN
jgi:cell shape-determining protein MreC